MSTWAFVPVFAPTYKVLLQDSAGVKTPIRGAPVILVFRTLQNRMVSLRLVLSNVEFRINLDYKERSFLKRFQAQGLRT